MTNTKPASWAVETVCVTRDGSNIHYHDECPQTYTLTSVIDMAVNKSNDKKKVTLVKVSHRASNFL